MSVISLFLACWLFVSFIMYVLFLVQRRTNDAGIVDVVWAACLALLAVVYALILDGYEPRKYLVMVIAGIWYMRLAVYLLFDRVIGREEDGRYQTIRKQWKNKAQLFLLGFFQIQALVALLLSISFLIAVMNPKPYLSFWDAIAICVWLIAFGGESIADYQLSRFRHQPENRGKTCRRGVWRYSRHPNYFFEWLHWLAYPLLALGSSYWIFTLLAPGMMLFFVLRVTGIPVTEAQALLSRKNDYQEYQKTTSAFFPWFPKSQ